MSNGDTHHGFGYTVFSVGQESYLCGFLGVQSCPTIARVNSCINRDGDGPPLSFVRTSNPGNDIYDVNDASSFCSLEAQLVGGGVSAEYGQTHGFCVGNLNELVGGATVCLTPPRDISVEEDIELDGSEGIGPSNIIYATIAGSGTAPDYDSMVVLAHSDKRVEIMQSGMADDHNTTPNTWNLNQYDVAEEIVSHQVIGNYLTAFTIRPRCQLQQSE